MKRTCAAKTRIKTDIIESFFFSRRFIHGFDFQNDLKIWSSNKVRHKQFYCQITKHSSTFCHFTSFAEETKETNFSVKSSWEVNDNVSKGRTVYYVCIRQMVLFSSLNSQSGF